MAWKPLRSEYGGDVHCFDVDPTVNLEDLPYLEAPCEHTAPPGKLHQPAGGDPWCMACLVAVGLRTPTTHLDWTGD